MKDARELPRALTPWAEYLQLLPAEQIVAFAPLVQQLDIAIGPLRVQTRGGGGEPDGFDGLTRRGAYDRLLLSEWLLADEMPEEFARRAVMSEHAFLQVARQDPAGARVSFVLFDAGPNQLGAPRIAHLAALIVLARRAEAAGASLIWGVLQRPDNPAQRGVTAAGLAYLFAARGSVEATDEHLAAPVCSTAVTAASMVVASRPSERFGTISNNAGNASSTPASFGLQPRCRPYSPEKERARSRVCEPGLAPFCPGDGAHFAG